MSKRNTKASPSNLEERTPVQAATASAGVKGALGHAMAELIIAEADAAGMAMERVTVSRKDKLARIIAMGDDDRVACREDLLGKQARIAEEAAAIPGRGLKDYMEDFPRANSVYVECSMWTRICKAVNAGWRPKGADGAELKQEQWPEWRILSMEATKALDAVGKPSANGKNPELVPGKKANGKGGKGRPQLTIVQKAVKSAMTALKDEKGAALPKNNRNLAQVIDGLLVDATLVELNEVAAVVENAIKRAQKSAEEAAKAMAKANDASKAKPADKELADNQSRTSTGAVVTHTDTATAKPKNRRERREGERTGAVNTASNADDLVARGQAIIDGNT